MARAQLRWSDVRYFLAVARSARLAKAGRALGRGAHDSGAPHRVAREHAG